MNPRGILVSPGPGASPTKQLQTGVLGPCRASTSAYYASCLLLAGRPVDSGISLQAVRELGPLFPLFGVCMGHQCIGEAFGGQFHIQN